MTLERAFAIIARAQVDSVYGYVYEVRCGKLIEVAAQAKAACFLEGREHVPLDAVGAVSGLDAQ